MKEEYVIVNTRILPDCFIKVLKARSLFESGQARSISEAAAKAGISRSTFYKYKEDLFPLHVQKERRAALELLLQDRQGVLSEVLNQLAVHKANILTISQSIPIRAMAPVSLSLNLMEVDLSLEALMALLQSIEGVCSVRLTAIE